MLRLTLVLVAASAIAPAAPNAAPSPPGKLVDLGGHKLHVYCTGAGAPTVVVENGLGDFSFDWALVQSRVARFTRICTYDRAGYAWSDPGPKPRTFAQLNLELRDALAKLGEPGPFLLVGHSYGGPVIRNFAALYPGSVAGIVFVDAAYEGLRVSIGGGRTIRLGDGAKGTPIPAPHEQTTASDQPTVRAADLPAELGNLDPMFKVLPPDAQSIQLWAQQLPGVYDAQNSETQWSDEYFAKWLATPQAGVLGTIPVIVLSQPDSKEGQAKLVVLSSNSKQIVVHSGHNMNLEAPAEVAGAIHEVVEAVRLHRSLQHLDVLSLGSVLVTDTVHHAIDNALPDHTLCGIIITHLPPGQRAWRVEASELGIEYGQAWDWEHEGDFRINCRACREQIGLPPLTHPIRL